MALRLREAVARVRAVRKGCLKGALGREARLLSLKKHHSNCKDSKRKTCCSLTHLSKFQDRSDSGWRLRVQLRKGFRKDCYAAYIPVLEAPANSSVATTAAIDFARGQ